ncbi:MAG: hypothetical protein JWP87_2306 [Labilithrix sp.]|nr:hypothetical protein [Labilithrix sp.]
MKSPPARTVVLSALMLCVSCGAEPGAGRGDRGMGAPLAIGPAAAARPAAPAVAEAPPRAPDDLALLMRVADPEQLVRQVAALLPPSAAAAASALDPAQVLTLLLGKRLSEVVDLGLPVDVASAGAGDVSFVVSLGVKPDAEPRLAEGLVLHERGGLVHIEKPDDAHLETGRLGACAFTPAAGRATTRLVCASDEAALTSTAAYLARNVAAEPLDVDARFTVPGRFLREKRAGTAAKAIGDAATEHLGSELVDTFLDEIERIDADVRFVGSGVEIALDLRLSARTSMLGRVIAPRTAPTPPPKAFYRLPGDAIVALHATGALPDDIAPLRKALAEVVEGTLIHDGYQPEKTRALRERLEALLLTGGPLVLGAGVSGGRDGAERALAALDSPRGEVQARSALTPWMMIEVDEPAEKWTQGLRDVVRRAEDADKTRKPGSKSSSPRDPDGDHVDLRVGLLDPALKLPKDTLHLEVLIAPRTKGARPTRKAHLFVVPKGGATWIGYSEDVPAITARLRLALDDTTDAGTLARSTEASSLRTRSAVGAGIVALGAVAYLEAKTSTLPGLRLAAASASRASSRGAHGAEILPWTVTADTRPGSVHVSAHTQATRQTVIDLLRAAGF